MGAMRLVAMAHLRRSRRSSLVTALLLAVVVAVVLAAVAGARRTDRSVSDFVASDKGADGYAAFQPPELGGDASPDMAVELERLGAIEGVIGPARFSDAFVELSGPSVPDGRVLVQGYVAMEPGGLARLSHFRVVDGRLADDDRPDEVMIDEELARDAELRIGSRFTLTPFVLDQVLAGAEAAAAGIAVEAEVVGIVRRPSDLRDPQDRQTTPNDYVVHQDVYLTSALWRANDGQVAAFTPIIGFDIEEGRAPETLLATIVEETGAYAIDHARFLEIAGTYKGVDRSASVHSRGLQVFAAVLALAGLFLVGQTLGRQISLEGGDDATLRALGVTPRQLWSAALLRTAPVAIGGALLGMAGAVALSPLTPLPGTVARRAELHPGVSVDALVLGGGGLVAVLAVALAATLPSVRRWSGRERGGVAIRPGAAARLAGRGLPVAGVMGVRFALEPGRGRTAVPVRTAIAMAVVSVALVIAAATFSASLSDSRSDARRFGVTWDVAAGSMTSPEQAVAMAERVGGIDGVDAFSAMGTTAYETSFGEVPAVMLRQERGLVTPLISDGRAPGRGEVALGALTMAEEGLEIGDMFRIDDPVAGSSDFVIVGQVVLNVAGVDVSIPPGRGALFDWSMLEVLGTGGEAFVAPTMFLVDAAPGRTAEVEEMLRSLFPTSTRAEPVEPLDLTNLGDAALLPTALGLVVALLGLGTVGHAMVSAVLRRRPELAILKAVGFARSDTRRAVAWQALTFGVLALLIGLPLGVAAGRVAWAVAAGQLGIPSHPVVSPATIAVVCGATLALLFLTALVPAQLATRVTAAAALRRD